MGRKLHRIEVLTKTLNQEQACEVREVRFLEGKRDFSQGFGHWTQCYLLGRFVSIVYFDLRPSIAPSEDQVICRQFIRQIAHH